VFTQIEHLRPDTHGHNVTVKVVSQKIVVEKARLDGTKIRVAECVTGDATGTLILTARNQQIDVCTPGSTIVVRNAKIEMFKGFMRLAVDKWGSIKAAPEPATFEVNMKNDVSAVEWELVTVAD